MKEVTILYLSQEAKSHIRGRPGREGKPTIYGMLTFARIAGEVFEDASKNNPYADYYLLKAEDAIHRCDKTLKQLSGAISKEHMQAEALAKRFSNTSADTEAPQEVILKFSSPYGFIAAHLLKDYDDLVSALNLCAVTGVTSRRQCERSLKKATRSIRSVYHSISAYKRIELSREALNAGVSSAEEAERLMGKLPAEVITQASMPEYGPKPPVTPQYHTKNITPISAVRQQ